MMKTDNARTLVTGHAFTLVAALLVIVSAASGSHAAQPVTGPELILWLDAQDIDGNSNAQLLDGQPIGRWYDKSGCGNHATQDNPDRQPTCRVAEVNAGPRFIHFAAAKGQYLSVGNGGFLDLEQMTAFVVARAEPSNTNMWLFGKNDFTSRWTGYGIAVQQVTLTPCTAWGIEPFRVVDCFCSRGCTRMAESANWLLINRGVSGGRNCPLTASMCCIATRPVMKRAFISTR